MNSNEKCCHWQIWLSALAVAGLQTLVIRLEGQPWWCHCGGAQPWISSAYSEHTSQHLVDPYSFSHVLHGFLFWWLLAWLAPRLALGWRFVIALVLEASWEILENSPWVIERYRAATAAVGYSGDSVSNTLGDLASAGVGFWLARWLGWRWTLALLIAIELILLVLIRDNLTLNVLMLILPLPPGLKEWQQGAA
jgi:MFS family permease